MTNAGWTFETLLTNGWYAHWLSGPARFILGFTYYRSEISLHTVVGHGETEAGARADTVRQANAWLRDHPGYQPREPWITRDDRLNERFRER